MHVDRCIIPADAGDYRCIQCLAGEGGRRSCRRAVPFRATRDLMRQTDAPKGISLADASAHQGVLGSRTFGKVANSTL